MIADRARGLADLFVRLLGQTTCHGYAIIMVDGRPRSITCFWCGRTSFNATDVAEKYCGACHVFHEARTGT